MGKILDGKLVSKEIKDEVKIQVSHLALQGVSVCLAVLQVGDDPASSVYVKNKEKACAYTGITPLMYRFDETVSEESLLEWIRTLNELESVHGILVQLPLPKHIDEKKVLNAIHPDKDVDGFHPMNAGHLFLHDNRLLPCTAASILQLLKRYDVTIDGKQCVVIGRSNIVGNPVAQLLQQENGTVTVVHSHTKNVREITSQADILVAAGQKEMIRADFVKDGAVVVDVGIHRDELNHLTGDVAYDEVVDKVSMITPVPGGVGPMTIARLMQNCVSAACLQLEKRKGE